MNLKRALDAVEQMLTRVGEVELAHVPQMELVRRDLLQDALRFYQEFLRERSDSPLVRAEAARAYRRVGQIQDLLGKRDDAEKAYLEAATLLDTLTAESPDNPTLVNELAEVHRGLGQLYHATRRWPEAETSLHKSVALLEQLECAHPEIPRHRRDLAVTLGNLGQLFRQMGELDRAEPAYQKSLSLMDRLRDADPGNLDYVALRARISLNVGLVFGAQGRVADAEATYREALKLNQRLASDHPDVVDHRRRLANTFNNLGVLYYRDGQHEKAEAAYQESLAHKEAVLQDYPRVVAFQVELAGAYGNMATQVRRRSPEEALKWEARAISILEKVLEKDARYVEARMALFNSLMGRAYALGRLGRHEEAAKDWRRVLEVSDGQPHILMRNYRPFAHLRLGDHVAGDGGERDHPGGRARPAPRLAHVRQHLFAGDRHGPPGHRFVPRRPGETGRPVWPPGDRVAAEGPDRRALQEPDAADRPEGAQGFRRDSLAARLSEPARRTGKEILAEVTLGFLKSGRWGLYRQVSHSPAASVPSRRNDLKPRPRSVSRDDAGAARPRWPRFDRRR